MFFNPKNLFKNHSKLGHALGGVAACAISVIVPACDFEVSSEDSMDSAEGSTGEDAEGSESEAGETTETETSDSSSESTESSTTGDEENSIVDIALSDDRFTTLVTALGAADLVTTLDEGGPFTVFAPTNAAFDALPEGALDDLLADKEALRSVLLHHVVDGTVMSTDLPNVPYAKSLLGQTLLVDLSNGVKVGGSNVSQADVEASNGVVHVVDSVILPPSGTVVDVAVGNPDFSTLVTALQTAELVDTLSGDGPFTVFAPTNAAFAALPEGVLDDLLANKAALTDVLLYHVAGAEVYSADLGDISMVDTLLEGQSHVVDLSNGVKIGASMVVAADVLATNGVIHVIDAVLVPPSE